MIIVTCDSLSCTSVMAGREGQGGTLSPQNYFTPELGLNDKLYLVKSAASLNSQLKSWAICVLED